MSSALGLRTRCHTFVEARFSNFARCVGRDTEAFSFMPTYRPTRRDYEAVIAHLRGELHGHRHAGSTRTIVKVTWGDVRPTPWSDGLRVLDLG